MHEFPRALVSLVALAIAADAQQTSEIVVMGGDAIPGLSQSVQGVRELRVNDAGEWVVHVGTNGTGPNTVVLSSRGLIMKTGDMIDDPAVTVSGVHVALTDDGDLFQTIDTTGVPTMNGTGPTVVRKNELTILKAYDPVNAPQLDPGTLYETVAVGAVDGSGRHLLVSARTQQTSGVAFSTLDVELDAAGNVIATNEIARAGTPLPQDIEPLYLYVFGALSVNRAGDYMLGAMIGAYPELYSVLYLNSTRIMRGGQPSIVPGLNWGFLGGTDLSDSGDFAFVASLTTATGPFFFGPFTDPIVVKNATTTVARTGRTHPAIAPATFSDLGEHARIDFDGEVMFTGKWDGEQGVFIDDELIARTNAPGIAYFDFVDFTRPGNFNVSENGRYVLFEAKLVGGKHAAVLIDRDGPAPTLCNGDGGASPGCTLCPCNNDAASSVVGGCLNSAGTSASLLEFGRPSVTRDTQIFELEGGIPSSFAVLVSGQNALPNQGPCAPGSGIATGLLDGLRCVGGNLARHGARATDTGGTVGARTNHWGSPNPPTGGILADAGLVAGQTRHFQAFYRELSQLGCGTGQNTSNARSITATP